MFRRFTLALPLLVTLGAVAEAQAPLDDVTLLDVPAPDPLARTKITLDYLHFYMRDLRTPPLVTTGPTGSQGIVGEPGTAVLRGGGRLPTRHGRYIGIRGGIEWWAPDDSPFGLDLSVTIMERNSSNLTYQWHDINPLARPFVDANTGANSSFVVAGNNPQFGPLSGSINVYSRMELFHEDVNAAFRLGRGDGWKLAGLAGAHFIQFRERLDLVNTSRILPLQQTVIGIQDHFQTFNKFYGGQVGLKGDIERGRWAFDAKGVLALGGNAEEIRAKGFGVIDGPGGRTVNGVGLLVQPSNTGNFTRTALNFVTEWNANLAFAVTPRVGVRVGYTLLTWSDPVRPGDQIEPINRNQVNGVGPAVPTIPFRTDFFWMQGVSVGLDAKW